MVANNEKGANDQRATSQALLKALKEIQEINSFRRMMTQKWDLANAEPFLTRICEIEGQNVAALLPEMKSKFHEIAKNRNTISIDFEDQDGGLDKTNVSPQDREVYPATLSVLGDGSLSISASSLAMNPIDEEIRFLGELFVCFAHY